MKRVSNRINEKEAAVSYCNFFHHKMTYLSDDIFNNNFF